MATTHVNLADLSPETASLIRRVLQGEQIVIDAEDHRVALRQESAPGLLITDVLARLEALEAARGYPLIVDESFVQDMQEIIDSREPLRPLYYDE